jgi:hypothetical protein
MMWEILMWEICEQAKHDWLAHRLRAARSFCMAMQSDVALWSELATKLTVTRSVPEAYESYTKCVSQRMQMTAQDGQRMFNDCQQIA